MKGAGGVGRSVSALYSQNQLIGLDVYESAAG